ncbi:MAG: homoserine dehydrogenase [Pirellulaceae bacterium]
MNKSKVAIVGLGTVGAGVAKILLDHGERVERHAGKVLWLEKAVVRDLAKPRDCDLPYGVVTDKLQEVLDDPEIEVVAQLIGGLEPARTIMLQLLESGKNIVTANKALLAVHGPELFDRARELGRSIAFEASVAGGVPIIANISQCLSANQITSLRGILNGTSNFILSQMEEGADYNDAVKEAQRLGYAEADPSMDVDGTDAAQKLAILAHLAFGARVHWDQIPKMGIDSLDTADLRWAKQLGYRIKLLATAKLHADVLDLHVSPTLVKVGTPLAEVLGANNAISVEGDMVGRVFYHGLGAGQLPTASAVVADLIDTAVGRTEITFRTLELWSQHEPRVTLSEHDQVKKRYYLRVNVKDHPGVLAQIAGCLGKEQISIASMIQKGMPDQTGRESDVSLVIMTHEAEEGAAVRAISAMNQLDSVLAPAVRLPVIDE